MNDAAKLLGSMPDFVGTPDTGAYQRSVSKVVSWYLLNYGALRKALAPTPREQELEAQNKALWELVGQAETALSALAENNAGWAEYQRCMNALSAIQKAKESKV